MKLFFRDIAIGVATFALVMVCGSVLIALAAHADDGPTFVVDHPITLPTGETAPNDDLTGVVPLDKPVVVVEPTTTTFATSTTTTPHVLAPQAAVPVTTTTIGMCG